MAQTEPQIALPDYPSEIQTDPAEISFTRQTPTNNYPSIKHARAY